MHTQHLSLPFIHSVSVSSGAGSSLLFPSPLPSSLLWALGLHWTLYLLLHLHFTFNSYFGYAG